MDGFEKVFEERYGDSEPVVKKVLRGTLKEWYNLGQQESAKQKDIEIDYLKTVIENLEMSVRSFTDGFC